MKISSMLLAAALTLTGVASAVAIARQTAVISGEISHGDRHPGPDSARVEAFLGALSATEPMICEMVTDQLGNFWSSWGDEGVGQLADASRNWEPVRDSLASAVTDPGARRRLVRALGDDDVCVRRAAAKMLSRSVPEASNALREALRAGSSRVREAAAYAIGRADDREFLTDLERASGDSDPNVAAMATWGLGELELPETLGRLVDLTGSREPRVRRAAAWGLGQIEDGRGVAPLIPLLRDSDVGTRIVAADALGELQSVQAAEPLAQALKDADPRVRRAAAHALGQLDELAVAPPELIDAVGSSDLRLRRAAAEALGEIGDARAVAALGRAMGDSDLETRRAVIHALAGIEDDATVPYLLRAIKDPDPEIRKIAVEALGERKEHY